MAAGRKFKLSLTSLGVLLAGFGLSAFSAGAAGVYQELIGGALGILAIYCGGNVSNKYVINKHGKPAIETQQVNSQ